MAPSQRSLPLARRLASACAGLGFAGLCAVILTSGPGGGGRPVEVTRLARPGAASGAPDQDPAPAAGAAGPDATAPAVSGRRRPDPHVQAYMAPAPASAPAQASPPVPAGPVEVPVNVDGCDHGYGSRGQCVPWEFPVGTADGCAWLAGHGFGPLAVRGPDRHRLDRDGDGTACGTDDTDARIAG